MLYIIMALLCLVVVMLFIILKRDIDITVIITDDQVIITGDQSMEPDMSVMHEEMHEYAREQDRDTDRDTQALDHEDIEAACLRREHRQWKDVGWSRPGYYVNRHRGKRVKRWSRDKQLD